VVPGDIGVMATYRKQVQKVRLLLRERGLGALRVGTVDDYQASAPRLCCCELRAAQRLLSCWPSAELCGAAQLRGPLQV
jgi:hypothetical protein